MQTRILFLSWATNVAHFKEITIAPNTIGEYMIERLRISWGKEEQIVALIFMR